MTGYWGTTYDYRAGSDADNLSTLQRELGWLMKQADHDSMFGTPDHAAKSQAKVDELRARIREAKKLAADPEFWSSVSAAENDWIAS